MFTFGYNVQVSSNGRHWTTVAKCIDQHTADALAFALHNEDRGDHVRVRRGTIVISDFEPGETPKMRK
jgi:hypothetical protein